MKHRLFMIIVFILLVLSGCGYNTMQANEEAVKAAWGDVESAYQRRSDLVPNLVEVVKGYAKHERETLESVTEARAKVGTIQMSKDIINNPNAFAQFQEAQAGMTSALSRLLVVVEQYPDLKANQNFMSLQEELTSTENKIAFSRQFYNDTVMSYNTQIEVFPQNFIAGMFHFVRREFFEVKDMAAREVPKVAF